MVFFADVMSSNFLVAAGLPCLAFSHNHSPGEVPEKHPTVVAAESLRERLAERCLDPKDEIRSRAVELIMDAALKSAPCLVWRDGREAHKKQSWPKRDCIARCNRLLVY